MDSTLILAIRGIVISIHEYGATARLEDGTLAAIPIGDFVARKAAYVASRESRAVLDLCVVRSGRHATASLAPAVAGEDGPAPARPAQEVQTHGSIRTDIAFEMRLHAYLRETEAWAPSDRPPPDERHFIRKRHRANSEARKKTT